MPQVCEGGWEEGINLQYPALPSRALTTFVSLVAAEGSPAPGWKLGVLHDVHPGPGRKRTSCLLSQIHIGSQVFFIRSEACGPVPYRCVGPWLLWALSLQCLASVDSGASPGGFRVTAPLSYSTAPPPRIPPPSQTPSCSRRPLQFLGALHLPQALAPERLPRGNFKYREALAAASVLPRWPMGRVVA